MEAKIVDGEIIAWGSLADVAPGVSFPPGGPDRSWRDANGVRTIVETLNPSASSKRVRRLSAPVLVGGTPRIVAEEDYPLAERRADMKRAINARFRALVAAGKTVGDTIVGLSGEAFQRLEQARIRAAEKAGAVRARTATRWEAITFADAAAAQTMLAALRAHYDALAEREDDLMTAVEDGDHATLDRIDVETGAIDGAGAWPG